MRCCIDLLYSSFKLALGVATVILGLCIGDQAIAASQQPMTFRSEAIANNNSSLGVFIVADGVITENTPADFEKYLKENEQYPSQILFNSDGGNLLAGLALGKRIRELKFNTFVGQWFPEGNYDGQPMPETSCYSACAYAFLGGVIRRTSPNAQIGFHQFYYPPTIPASATSTAANETLATSQALSGVIISYLVFMGVDAALFVEASQKLGNDVFVPSSAELELYRVVSPHGFSAFELDPVGKGVVANSLRVGEVERYDEAMRLSVFCRAQKPYLSITGNKYADPTDTTVLIFLDGRDNYKDGIQIPAERVQEKQSPDGKFLIVEAALDADTVSKLVKANRWNIVAAVATAQGGPYPVIRDLSREDKKKVSAAFKLCVG